jgi:hypothetical protein
MSKKGGTKVEAVDPWEMGRADATFNRIDTYTPFGSLTYGGPNRNIADLQLNPYLAGTESRRMMSDRMLMDMALGRQSSMQQTGLPALTESINPGALNEFFGLPSSMQSGYDQYPTPGSIPNIAGQPTGGKGGGTQRPMPPPEFNEPTAGVKGGPNIAGVPIGRGLYGGEGQPRSVLDPAAKGGAASKPQAQPTSPNVGGSKGGAPQAMASQEPGAPTPVPGAKGGNQNIFGGTVGEAIGNPLDNISRQEGIYNEIDPSTFGQMGSLDRLQDFNLDRGRVEQSMFDRSASLLNPQFDQAEQRKVADLRARGIPRDSEAFEREMSNFRRDKDETFQRLADQSVLAGGAEQSRLFGLSSQLGDRDVNSLMTRYGLAGDLGGAQGQAQQQLFGMADLLSQRDIQAQLQNANMAQSNRATQFNELASLLGLQQVASPGLNNFFSPGNVDMMGAYGLNQQANISNANRNAAMKGGMLGGLGQLGGAAIGAGGWGGLFGMGR